MDFKPNDHVSITVKDSETSELATLTAVLIAADASGVLVAPDDTLMGLLPTLFIAPDELVSISLIAPPPPSAH